MIDKIFSFFDEDHQFKQVWELKLIKFDIDLEQQVKPYERYLGISHTVEDVKGNPGMRGHFYVTNLRLVWHGANDKDINLSIGLDTINNISIKPIVAGPNGSTKHMLLVKTQSPKGNKYQFKFSVYTDKQLIVFKKAIQVFKQSFDTKFYRSICTNLKINYEHMKFQTLQKQEIINRYKQGKYYQENRSLDCQVVLTNIRLVILMLDNKDISYGIPWIMIQSFQKAMHWQTSVLQLHIRGLLSNKEIFIKTKKNFKNFQSQFMSLSTTYCKNPILGIDSTNAVGKDFKQVDQNQNVIKEQFQQVFETKINLKRNKKAYQSQNNSQGNLQDTFFNQQLGIMMQKLPQGTTRSSLWQILG